MNKYIEIEWDSNVTKKQLTELVDKINRLKSHYQANSEKYARGSYTIKRFGISGTLIVKNEPNPRQTSEVMKKSDVSPDPAEKILEISLPSDIPEVVEQQNLVSPEISSPSNSQNLQYLTQRQEYFVQQESDLHPFPNRKKVERLNLPTKYQTTNIDEKCHSPPHN